MFVTEKLMLRKIVRYVYDDLFFFLRVCLVVISRSEKGMFPEIGHGVIRKSTKAGQRTLLRAPLKAALKVRRMCSKVIKLVLHHGHPRFNPVFLKIKLVTTVAVDVILELGFFFPAFVVADVPPAFVSVLR